MSQPFVRFMELLRVFGCCKISTESLQMEGLGVPLGWIDFSKTERNKVLSVLDLLSEQGTLDELGIMPIRDGFSELFFPGTTTIQTRAKYFFIVPYALRDLELGKETNPARAMRELDRIEQECGKQFLKNNRAMTGIIGARALANGSWVKQAPSNIYWAGLRKYGFFLNSNLTLSEYVRAICALKAEKKNTLTLGNRNDNSDVDQDDQDAGLVAGIRFWDIPTYRYDWRDNLVMQLTPEEGAFLKKKMITRYPDSMLAYVLENHVDAFFQCSSFQELDGIIKLFPPEMRDDYKLALKFSDFLEVINIQYNLILSDGKNQEAVRAWNAMKDSLDERASVDLTRIVNRLKVYNPSLVRFLSEAKEAMLDHDEAKLKNAIVRRERELKTTRAKTLHPGEFDPEAWYGIGALDYRFSRTKTILADIVESEGSSC